MPDKKLGIELIGKDRLSPALRRIGGVFSQLGSKVSQTLGRMRAFGTGLKIGFMRVLENLPALLTRLTVLFAAMGIGIQQAFKAAIENSGQLKREWGRLEAAGKKIFGVIGDLLAPAVSLLADQFDKLAKKAVTSGGQITNVFETKLGQLAEKALRWGVNVSTQFATGIVKGASAALVAAMNFIGGILSGWLKGASPPKVAKDIGKWGAQAFTEWLRGFGEAEWDVLNGLQGPLQSALGLLADMGKMAADAVGPAFVKLSKEIAGALTEFQKSGKMPLELFAKIAKAGGQFGQDLAELARRQFSVAAATKAVEDAERRLTASRKGEDDARDKVVALRDEYKALLKSGADPRLIRAKQAEIKAAQAGLRTAKLGTVQAEKDVDTAREKEDALQKQLYLQQQVVQQLLEIARAGLKIEAPTLAGIGGGAIELPALPTEQFTALKGNLAAVFADIFKPFKDAYDKDMAPAIERVVAKWEEFKGILLDFWNSEPVQKLRTWIEELFPEGTLKTLGEWTGALLAAAVAAGILALAVAILSTPIILLGIGIAILAGLWTKYGDQITTTVEQLVFIIGYKLNEWKEKLIEIWGNVVQWVADLVAKFEEFKANVAATWEGIKANAAEIWEGIKALVTQKIEDLFAAMGLDLDDMKEKWAQIWEDVKLVAAEVWDRISKAIADKVAEWYMTITGKIQEIKDWWDTTWGAISAKLEEILTAVGIIIAVKVLEWYNTIADQLQGIMDWIGGLWQKFVDLGAKIIDGLKQGVLNAAGRLIGSVTGAIQNALDAAKRLLGIASPSKWAAKEIGEPFMAGIAEGIRKSKLPKLALADAMGSLMRGPSLAPAMVGAGAGGNMINITVNLTGGASKNDALMIAEAIDRKMRLKGVKRTVR